MKLREKIIRWKLKTAQRLFQKYKNPKQLDKCIKFHNQLLELERKKVK